jgi:hypothetical protein
MVMVLMLGVALALLMGPHACVQLAPWHHDLPPQSSVQQPTQGACRHHSFQ